MKKFVSLCAFVAALSFVSCGGNTTSNNGADTTSVCEKGACDSVNKECCIADSTKVGCCKGDSVVADTTAAEPCCAEPQN